MNSKLDTQLDHEIEKYDSSTGELIAWVRIPALLETLDEVIYVYYGNNEGGLANQWNIAGVWEGDFKGVWHLNEDVADEGSNNNTHIDTTPKVKIR